MTLFERGLMAHFIADWLLQNDWMARHKSRVAHPAAWVHAGIHAVCLGLALGWAAGLLLAVTHLLVDTQLPLRWWQRFYGQTTTGEVAVHVAIWTDQAIHLVCLGAAVLALK